MRRRPKRKLGSLSARRRHFLYRRLGIFSIFFAVAFTIFVWLVNLPQFGISEVLVSRVRLYPALALETSVRAKISGFYLGIIPRSLFVALPKKSVETNLLSQFPGLKSVQVERNGLQSLVVTSIERTVDSVWCRKKDKTEECFALDHKGFVFAHSSNSDEGLMRFYGFLDTVPDPIGAEYLSVERFAQIKSFLGALKGVDFDAVSFERTQEKEYIVKLSRGSKLILKENADLDLALSNFSSLLNDTELRELFGQKPLPFEYVDFRLENKVFYKRRNVSEVEKSAFSLPN